MIFLTPIFLTRQLGYGDGSLGHEKKPRPGDGEWGWKDAWFSETGLLAAKASRL